MKEIQSLLLYILGPNEYWRELAAEMYFPQFVVCRDYLIEFNDKDSVSFTKHITSKAILQWASGGDVFSPRSKRYNDNCRIVFWPKV